MSDVEVLSAEIDASQGSFIHLLRFELLWDHPKFIALCWAMHNAAKSKTKQSSLPRELSLLFWYCGTFVPEWIAQRDFRIGQPHIDYDRAIKVLRTLGNGWFGDDCVLADDEFARQLAAQ